MRTKPCKSTNNSPLISLQTPDSLLLCSLIAAAASYSSAPASRALHLQPNLSTRPTAQGLPPPLPPSDASFALRALVCNMYSAVYIYATGIT